MVPGPSPFPIWTSAWTCSELLLAHSAGAIALIDSIDVVDVVRAGLHGTQRIDGDGLAHAGAANIVFRLDLRHALRLFHVAKRFVLGPGEGRAMLQGVLFEGLGSLIGLGVLFAQPHPFDLLLKATEGASTA